MNKLQEIIDRGMPHNDNAERAVCGAMMQSDTAVLTALDILTAEYFYNAICKHCFSACKHLFERQVSIDVLSVAAYLKSVDMLDTIGGATVLTEIVSDSPAPANVKYHCQIVEAEYKRRLGLTVDYKIAEALAEGREDVDSIISQGVADLLGIIDNRKRGGFKQLGEIISGQLDVLTDRIYNNKPTVGHRTGYKHLDRITNGLKSGDLIIIAGRPGMGKTAFMMNLARGLAINNDLIEGKYEPIVGVFSMEQAAEAIALREMANSARIDSMLFGDLPALKPRFRDIAAAIIAQIKNGAHRILIDDTCSLKPTDLFLRVKKLKLEYPGLIAICTDYLQIMGSANTNRSRFEIVTEHSQACKTIAREFNVVHIALSQLSRKCEERTDKRPTLSDLRESGAIEQDADLIGFLYRDSVYNPTVNNDRLAELNIAKQRNGPTGTLDFVFFKESTRFEECANATVHVPEYVATGRSHYEPAEKEDLPF